MKETTQQLQDRDMARKRHDLDSGIFQGRYVNFKQGKYTDEFIYGRYQIFEEVKNDLDKLPKGAKVLDLGCGTGHLAQFIKEKGFEVVGLDPSEGMLGFARQNFPDIEFVEGVSVNLPFPENTFDYVVSIEVLRYLNPKDVEETYGEMYRVLKPGGFFHVTHVNRWATDGYLVFYNTIKFMKNLAGKPYHNCYFTSAGQEANVAKKYGYSKIESVGRMFGTVRMGFKFGKAIGRLYTKWLEVLSKNQRFVGGYKSFAGHLITRGYK